MKFSYNFLQSFFKEKLPSPEELGEILMMHFFEVEEVKKIEEDYVLDIDILSNRAGDCFSHTGVAREIAAITGMKFEEPEVKIKEKGEDIAERIEVDVRSACKRYMLRAVDNVTVKSSPIYIQKRLRACGVNPINNIVDAANYVMLETGQPLHVFDADKIEGEKISVRYARKREKIVTLDEKRHELNDNILLIADELSPLGIAGIKGGIVPEIDKETKRVYIESANFDSVTIRRGSNDLKIRTDASLRFEHGLSTEFTKIALDRVVQLITEVAGGDLLKGVIDYYPEKEKEKEINFDIDELRKVLGTEISIKEVEKILRALDFKIQRGGSKFFVTVPFFRVDVSIKEDVFEEIGRIYGYENIKPIVPEKEIVPAEENIDLFIANECKDILKNTGLNEAYSYSFINEEASLYFKKDELIEMEKPVSLEFKYLRPSLLLNLFKFLAENEKNYSHASLFEIGSIFKRKEGVFFEEKVISVVLLGDDFYRAKGVVDVFLKNITGETAIYKKKDGVSLLDYNKTADVVINNVVVGVIGEICPKLKKHMKIKGSVFGVELSFEKIKSFYKETKTYEEILRFPPVLRDLAVLVPEKTEYEEVLKKMTKEGGSLLRRIELFDTYEGKEIPQGTKSFAFRLIFQSKSKTLSSEEVNKTQEKIIETLEATPEWKVRK